MLNLKKTAVAVLALSSSAVFAGSMGPVCSAVNVTVPCESTAWAFGAKALYLKADSNNNAGFNPVVADATADHAPNYNWGFQIEGAYHFNTGNDLNLNWYHISKSKSRSFGPAPTAAFNNGFGTSSTATFAGGNSSIDPKWDAVNIEVGQHVDFGDNKAIRFHGGAQYARVANSVTKSAGTLLTQTVAATTTAVSYTDSATYNPTYNGFGPRLGMDMSYDWGNGLGIYANGATAILAGTRAQSFTYSDSLNNSVSGSQSRTAIVPAIDAKLGATYTYAMAQGDLTLDAGWMWVNYFNVHADSEGHLSNLGLEGPFIGLKWMGNIA